MAGNKLRIGSLLPAFGPLRATDGRMIKSSDFATARAFVLVFSCNHCPYVQHIREGFARFAKEGALGGLMLTEPDYGTDLLSMRTAWEGRSVVAPMSLVVSILWPHTVNPSTAVMTSPPA